MSTFTSSLPNDLLARLDREAKKLSIPKNRILEKALSIYLDQLNRAEYLQSFKKAAIDQDFLSIAEEGMAEYLKQIQDEAG